MIKKDQAAMKPDSKATLSSGSNSSRTMDNSSSEKEDERDFILHSTTSQMSGRLSSYVTLNQWMPPLRIS